MTAVIKQMSLNELKEVPEITEGLENAVFEAAKTAGSVPALLNALKSKRYTHSRLRRILLSAFIGLTRELQQTDPPHLRVLAVGENGRSLLREINEKAAVPVITKPASIKTLGGACEKFALFEARADSLWSLAAPSPEARGDGGFFTRSPFVIR
jgi:predicted nucleotidyltransferase